jgi:hypothetical protein
MTGAGCILKFMILTGLNNLGWLMGEARIRLGYTLLFPSQETYSICNNFEDYH